MDLSRSRNIAVSLLFCMAFALSMTFSQFIFPRVSGPLGSEVGTDGYDRLGRSIYALGTFSYYPDQQPTVMRGPGYPALIAPVLAICESCYPISIQLVQAALHGCTCVMVFFIGLKLLDRRRAFIASLICAGYPSLIWYSARMVTETFSVFLFTLVVFLILSLQEKPSKVLIILLGIALGVSSLVRQVFLPLVFVTPTLLFVALQARQRIPSAASVLIVASLVIIPWTMRNAIIADRFIPVHGLSGYNAQVGDYVAEHLTESPFGYLTLVLASDASQHGTGSYIWLREADARSGAAQDHKLLMASIQRYAHDPVFFLRKIALNALLFWGYGSAPAQTFVSMVLQIPLAIAFCIGASRLIKREGLAKLSAAPIWLAAVYYLGHLPFFAIARYGVVLIPTMLIYASSLIGDRGRSGESSRVDSSPRL